MLFLVSLFSLQALAQQARKGSFLLGNQYSVSSKENKITLSVRTQVAYFVNNNLALGLGTVPMASSVIYKAWSTTTQNPAVDSVDRYMKNVGIVSPLVRYYFLRRNKWLLYTQGTLELYQFRSNIENNSQVIKKLNLGFTGSIGISYLLGEILTLDVMVNQPFSKGIVTELPLGQSPFVGVALNVFYSRSHRLQ